jgi:hypothetical protein
MVPGIKLIKSKYHKDVFSERVAFPNNRAKREYNRVRKIGAS